MATYTERPDLHPRGMRQDAILPYGLRVAEVRSALEDLYAFLHNVNRFLTERGWERLEETLEAATFSTLISEMVVQSTSKHSKTLIKNRYHNGRPDLLPTGEYPDDEAQQADEGVEVKASRNDGGWQGHNVESGWIMIFQYRIDLETMPIEERAPTMFVRVLLAQLEEKDWSFSGRRGRSRRTPTASILRTGKEKLVSNPVYLDPTLARPPPSELRAE